MLPIFFPLNEFSATGLSSSQEKDLFREESHPDPQSEFLLNKSKKIPRIQIYTQFLGTVRAFGSFNPSWGYVKQDKSLVHGPMSDCSINASLEVWILSHHQTF